jgi:hypothetical protein
VDVIVVSVTETTPFGRVLEDAKVTMVVEPGSLMIDTGVSDGVGVGVGVSDGVGVIGIVSGQVANNVSVAKVVVRVTGTVTGTWLMIVVVPPM